MIAPYREALRRAQSVLAVPTNAPAALHLGWRAADTMWRAAGDSATDYNHYTKRAILGGVYAATLLAFVNDESEGYADTKAFLARRIEGIMKFEKAKARITSGGDRHFSIIGCSPFVIQGCHIVAILGPINRTQKTIVFLTRHFSPSRFLNS